MMSSPCPRPRAQKNLLPRTGLLLVVVAALCLAPVAVESATCDRSGCGYLTPTCGGSPATPAPASLWGELQPTDVGPLPHSRDTTFFNEFRDIYSQNNWYRGLSIQNNYLVTAMAYGLTVWDLHQNPTDP